MADAEARLSLRCEMDPHAGTDAHLGLQLHYRIVNAGTESLLYGEDWSLEQRREDGWARVNPYVGSGLIAVRAIGYSVEPNRTGPERTVVVSNPDLPCGLYRLVKSVHFGRGRDREDVPLYGRFLLSERAGRRREAEAVDEAARTSTLAAAWTRLKDLRSA